MENQESVLRHVEALLNIVGIPNQYQSIAITKMLGNTRYDMNLHMEFMQNVVRFFCYERGELIMNQYVDDDTLIKYLIITEVIKSYYSLLAYKEHIKADHYIDIEWQNKEIEKSYQKLGNPYRDMYMKGISIFNISKNLLGVRHYY